MTHPPTAAPALEPPAPMVPPHPAVGKERNPSLDVLRGFALLGILVPNIFFFAWPAAASMGAATLGKVARQVNPDAIAHDAANAMAMDIMAVGFLGKFMFLFATLFGAGVYFFDRKFHRVGEHVPLSRGAGLWYTRIAWLLGIGLCHAFLMWYGDILVWYAVAGMGLVWWLRRLNAWVLLLVAVVVYSIGTAVMLGLAFLIQLGVDQGDNTAAYQAMMDPNAELAAYRGGSVPDMIWMRFTSLLSWYVIFPFTFFWQTTGLMLGGLALTKLGVYTGARSARFYALMGVIGIPLGLALTIGVFTWFESFGLHPIAEGTAIMSIAQPAGMPTALGYAGVVLLVVKLGWLKPVTTALAAVGRTALTSYLLQTLICTTLFYGHGFGLFAEVQFPALWGVVAGVWCANIAFSLVWLRFFRFGPVEWLWRSLTYLKLQPLMR